MKEFIKTGEELQKYLWSYGKLSDNNFIRYNACGVMVTSKVRKEYLTSDAQGLIVINGMCWRVNFKSIGGGVYTVHLGSLK